MKCELCHSNSGDRPLCRVCAEAVQRVINISVEGKRTQVDPEPGKSRGAAAGGR